MLQLHGHFIHLNMHIDFSSYAALEFFTGYKWETFFEKIFSFSNNCKSHSHFKYCCEQWNQN